MKKLYLSIAIFCLLPFKLFAEMTDPMAPGPDDGSEKAEDVLSEAPESGFRSIKRGAFDLGIGAGGFFSSGSQTASMLMAAEIGYRFTDSWRLSLAYDVKMQPWLDSRSLFQTIGPAVRFSFLGGAFISLEFGVALAFVQAGEYQQQRRGLGWGVKTGYVYLPHPNVGLAAQLAVNQRWLSELYTDFGLMLGPAVRF